MKVDSEVVKKGIIVIGIFITTIGLTLHLSIPGMTRSGFPLLQVYVLLALRCMVNILSGKEWSSQTDYFQDFKALWNKW